ncbi:hypothetical protein [Ruminococcus sp.]|uniref:hypothetical protein n=1 Tax=Ruminococcus sp. TaxID=41978 RepID=UPI0025E1A1A2|nr:hypothetical protein [Ruminococcus sp.]
MAYKNLNFLLLSSSSGKAFYNALPDDIKVELQEQPDHIHTLFQLHQQADVLSHYGKLL